MAGPFIGAGTQRRRRARTVTGLPIPSTLLLSNRLNQMGFGGYAGSDGTDTNGNTRISLFNETGATVTRIKLVFTNWRADATNEVAGYNTIMVAGSFEYPAGTFNQLTFSGAASVSIPVDGIVESDELTLTTPFPNDAQGWARTYVSVSAGQKWPQGYLINTTRGEAADFATGVDKTMSGTIANATPTANRRGFGPSAIRATAWTGVIRKIAIASVGDSILMQAGDGNFDARGSGGWNGRAMSARCPHLNIAIAGTSAFNNQPANFARRLALLKKSGATHILCNWGFNDISAGRLVTQIQADIQAIWNNWTAEGFKVIQCTISPRTTAINFSVQSLTAAATVVSAQCNAHGFTTGMLVAISGASPSQYNGTFAVNVIDANNFTYTAATAPGSSPATGTVVATSGWRSISNQTVFATNGGFTGGASSRRSQLNAWIRTKPSPLWAWFELADPMESARDSGLFGVNAGWADPSKTSDGQHPNVTNTSTQTGGHYTLKDALIGRLDDWLAL